MYERILKLLKARSGYELTKRYGLSQGHQHAIRKGKEGKAAGFWMRLALDCLELLPEGKRKKALEKREKKA